MAGWWFGAMGRGIEYIVGGAGVVASSIHSSTAYESDWTIDARGSGWSNRGCCGVYVGGYDWGSDTSMGAGMVVAGYGGVGVAAIMANAR